MPTSTRRQAQARNLQNDTSVVEVATDEIMPSHQVNEHHALLDQDMDEDEQIGDDDEEVAGMTTLCIVHSLTLHDTYDHNRWRLRAISASRSKRDIISSLMDCEHSKTRQRRSCSPFSGYVSLLAI